MMRARRLGGELEELGLEALFRLIRASGVRGRLEIQRPEGIAVLEVAEGMAKRPGPEAMRVVAAAAAEGRGRFRLELVPGLEPGPDSVELDELLQQAEVAAEDRGGEAPSVELLPVHHLREEAPEDPLSDLVGDLDAVAPEDLALAPVGVVASDPRPWRGGTELRWRRRGWQLRLVGTPEDVAVEELDLLLVHHSLSITRVGSEGAWLELVQAARAADPPRPVIWVGPLGDPRWVYRLVSAGVGFLLPPPVGVSGEPLERFLEALETVIEEQLQRFRREEAEPFELAPVLDALLSETDLSEALAALLQLAARRLDRAAIVEVTPTAFRFRAAVGYRPAPELATLPRGLSILERVARGGSEVVGVEGETGGEPRLAAALGLERLPETTCLLPMLNRGRVTGILIGDGQRGGGPSFDQLVRLVRRMGRVFANG